MFEAIKLLIIVADYYIDQTLKSQFSDFQYICTYCFKNDKKLKKK